MFFCAFFTVLAVHKDFILFSLWCEPLFHCLAGLFPVRRTKTCFCIFNLNRVRKPKGSLNPFKDWYDFEWAHIQNKNIDFFFI